MTARKESKSGNDKEVEKEVVVSHKDTITLEVLQVIKDAQSQHGLKHGDYHRYRGYCSRRLKRIRKSLGFVQATGSKSKSTFHAKKITNEVVFEAAKNKKDPIRYLYIPLMTAERAWSYAMALKQEANTEPRKRFHLIRRLFKAVKNAEELERLCNEEPTKCDARTKLESQAYCAYLTGIFYFETEKWTKAQEYLKKAQAIYVKLCEAISDDDTSVHYRQRVDELKPTLRYCAFNIGEQGVGAQDFIANLKFDTPQIEDDILASKLDQLILQTREKQAVTLSEVVWLGKSIAVKQEKIRAFLLSVQEMEVLDSPKVSQLEKLLFECRDCIQVLRDANQEKSALYYYLLYLRLYLTCQRNLLLIKNSQNPSDLIRLYEIIITSLNEIKSLPLEQYFAIDEGLETFLQEIDAQIVAYKAFRCYYIGKVGKLSWKESVALLHRSAQYCAQCLNNKFLKEQMKEELKQLQAKADADKFTIYANSLIAESGETKAPENKGALKPLIERLDEYVEDSSLASGSANLVHFPPKFRPIPCKPLFFDLALNHIHFPSLEEEVASPKAGGLTGFVKGWLSGGWRK
ncbi:Signal recognition particle protein-like protein [Dinothrombium tinctorium]|uniref:Signal recognition particle subunit SRP68 n=1 Tax=Dinothrombium tinctorium TaxID=1965070 RepID=A0A3S3P4Z3_9ACAR|nr:Signal recognition particle protein-like protein [Dinothrombium tinctorium]